MAFALLHNSLNVLITLFLLTIEETKAEPAVHIAIRKIMIVDFIIF